MPFRAPLRVAPAAALVAALLNQGASRSADLRFETHLVDPGASETAAVADISGDGRPDIVSGDYWYEAPAWRAHRFRTLDFSSGYIDVFSDLPLDVDGDGRVDVVSVTWFARKIAWWKNPGATGAAWTEASIDTGFPVEFALLVDLDNDGRPRELLPQSGDFKRPQAWYEAVGGAWRRHEVSPQTYGHGIGAGDVNGDGRTDILTPKGWLEAPPDPRSGPWRHHTAWDETARLGFMHAGDVNGDGRSDVLFGSGHDYGVFWLEHGADGGWTRRVIDETWSQAHASTLVDLNGDGRTDFVTGKRFMAHNGRDPGEREPLGVYWYEHRRTGQGAVEWMRHLISYGGRVGGGMQIPVVDIDGDGDLDVVVAGKSGLFLLENVEEGRRKKAEGRKK